MEPKSILVIDDDADVLDLICAALETTGAHVDRASTREDIIERLFQNDHYDLIITDVWMPWISGLQVANIAQMVGADVPVLFVSGLADPSLEDRVRIYGDRCRLLRKPFDPAALVRVVDEMLAREQGPEATATM
jgi:DNA-binding response OmpR family regulator